jgi:D-3-phosphoglycerate dehydrogenase
VVVVTPRSFGMHDPGLRRRLEAEVGEVRYRPGPLAAADLAEAVRDADGLLAGLDQVSAEVFAGAPGLRVVARYGVGVDRVDLAAAARHGVTVTVTPGANANAVAEMTVALLFALARPLVAGRARAQGGEWPALSGVELAGRTLGLVGLGRIGSLVAAKAAGLGMVVLAHDPYLAAGASGAVAALPGTSAGAAPAAGAGAAANASLVDLATLVAGSDFVSLHAPLTPQTRGMVDRRLFEQMKAGSALINTARGELVNEADLVWALDEGPLRAAALDVLAEEPPRPGHPLLGRDDVLVTPHMGPHTAEATSAMGAWALDDLLAVLSGRAPRYPI